MRTYFAQLACLGLFWKDAEKQFSTTYAGEELINANNPMKILRCQLLRMQYPSVYGLGPNVRIAPALQVKPFVFLIKLLQDNRLGGYLTCDDMAVGVVYGHTHADHNKCVTKILKLRASGKLSDVIDSVDDIRTPRRYTENNPDEDFVKGLQDAKDIANTAKNYLSAVQLVVPDTEDDRKFILTNRFEQEERIVLTAFKRLSVPILLRPSLPIHLHSTFSNSLLIRQRFGDKLKQKSVC